MATLRLPRRFVSGGDVDGGGGDDGGCWFSMDSYWSEQLVSVLYLERLWNEGNAL